MDSTNMLERDWRHPAIRQNMVEKITEALQNIGAPRNAAEMENQIFQKAQTQEDYRNMVTKLVICMQNQKNKKQQSETMDPINALQNLTNQGARNPMSSQMMNAGNNQNPANVLQNLIHQRAGQQQMQGMPNMQGMRANQAMQNTMTNVVGNQMQQGNAMPPGAMNSNNMNMNMGTNMGQQGNPGGSISNTMVGQMQSMPNMQGMRANQAMPNIIGNAIPNSMPNAGTGPMQQASINVMQTGAMSALNANNMNTNNVNMNNMGGNIAQQNNSNAQMPNNIVGQMQMQNMQGMRNNQPIPNTMPNAIPNQLANSMQQANVPPGAMNTNNMNMNITGNIVPQPNASGQISNNMAAQMNPMNPMNPMLQHINRNQPAANAMFQGIRNTAPNQPFFRKSPSPSAPSPMSGSLPNQMIPSPALVQMVPSPQVTNIMSQRNVMAQSPSNTNLNTPGQTGAAPSPLNPQEEHLYREKYRQLTKYIEPLKRMMARMGSDDEKLLKMNKLLEILCNPNQRIPLETLMKCEVALEKMDLKSYSMASSTSTFGGGSKEHNVNNLLLEAISANLQSPIGNHTLQRTFRPCIETLFGSDIKNLPAKAPRLSSTADNRSPSSNNDVPLILQGEIARLDRKFHVSFDPSNRPGSKMIQLICSLDDTYLPSIPPINVTIPADYPLSSPNCTLLDHDFNSTPFFAAIQRTFSTMFKTSSVYSLSHILDKWEMSVRQAYTSTIDPDLSLNLQPVLELGA